MFTRRTALLSTVAAPALLTGTAADARLFELLRRHRSLSSLWPTLDGSDAAGDDLYRRIWDVEAEMAQIPAEGAGGMAAKLRIYEGRDCNWEPIHDNVLSAMRDARRLIAI